MSQYGRHPQHYHHQSSVMPEKPTSWDMVESAAAINAAAASIVNSRYVGGGGFPNGGYPNLNDSGGNGGPSAVGGAGGYSDNSNGAMSGVGGMSIGQQQQQHQQSMQQQHWRAVRLPTAASAAYYSGQLPTTNPWMNHQQQRQMQQQQQLQQLAHPSLNILSANAPTFLNPLTSPTSPTVPSSQTTVWSTKLPQQNMLPLDVDDLSKHDLREQQQQQRNVDHHHRHLQQQQSPSYGGHFSSPTSFGVEMGGGSFNGILPTASVESSAVSANAGALSSPQQQQSPNYARHHSSSNMASTSMIGEIKTMPLYHSSSTTELDTLRAFASSASAKATVTEPFPTSSNKSMHGVPVSQSVPTSIPNPTKSPQFFEGQQLHSPRNNVFNNNNLLNRMNGDNNNGGSSMTNSSAFCRPNSTVNKQSPQTSPIASTGQPSGGTAVSTANNDLEIAKTMLSIRTCQTPTSSLENSALESSKSPNANCYQQISPADKSNLSSESPVNGISASSDNEEVTEPPNASATVENGHKEENDDDDMKRLENVEECHEIEEGEKNMDACKSPNALSIVESMNVDMVEKEEEGINSPASTPTSLVHRPESNNRLTPVHTPAHLSSSTTSKNRNSYAQISSDTLQPSKMLKENNSSPDSNLSMPSPMLSAMSFPSFAAASSLQIPLSFGGHTSASLVSGPQNTGAMGNVSLQNIQSMSSQQGNVYTCQICRFSSTSKFHFNSHMNTHTDHKCKYCDYTSRTVGRLKRHMNDFHTHSDRMETPPTNVNQESQDSCGNMSQPPSPDDSIALMDQQLESVVSSVAEHNQSGGIAKPVSSNKPKTYRCKQCHHVARSKNEFWDHQRSHIKNDRVLSCPKCSFVTEYKHHLEYHLRNHFGSKPFKCTKCNYTCVNKSMLNSHMKSHSNFYQYRCMDCTYATKYCHSLKLHLRKYSHTPATVMNPDGTAVENIVLDAFGNRRSSKTKKSDSNTPPSNNMMGQTTSSSTSLLPPMTSPSVVSGTSMVNPSFAPFIDLIKQQQELAAMVNMGISTWGAQLPRVPDVSIKNEPMAGSSNSGNNNEGYPPSQVLKCNFCNFHTSDGKDSLAAHMLKHIMENKELCRMYGFTDGTGTSGSTGSGSSTPGADRDYSMENSGQFCGTPVEHHRSSGSGGFFGGASGRNANSPMHHEISQDSNSPASTSGGKISGDEGALGSDHVNVHSGNNNRRKGKAFKLDKIALRLQGRVSPTQQDYNSTNDQVATDETVAAEKDLANGRIATSLVASGNQTVSNFKSSSGNVNSSRSSDISGVHNNMRSHKHQSHNVRLNRAESTSSLVGSSSNRQSLTNANGRETAHSATDYDLGGHTAQPISIDWSNAYVCNYCEIAFKDCIMHTMHMGYHCIQDPFKCNSCGQVNKDKLDMFLHIARAPHS